ncbi:MAG: hypothetical protein QNI84_10040 [Henriciella sp.]|nr:hypothetical protein [Henriciella sp.]
MTDLTVAYSKLVFDQDGVSHAPVQAGDTVGTAALLLRSIEHEVAALTGDAPAELVTVSTDITGKISSGEAVFKTRLDRKTRTLIFIGGEATQDDRSILRMTTIYRIG